MTPLTARQEWASMWPLALACTLGVSGSAMFAFVGGVYMESVTSEFGWSRAQYSSAFMLMMVSGLFIGPAVGSLIDRVGPRKVALFAIVPFALTISLFGLVTGKLWQWYGICLLLALFQGGISQIVWVKAIVARFKRSRGLAIAVTLAGLGFGSFIWPLLAAFCIDAFGWRAAFPLMATLYVVVALPLAFLFLHGPPVVVDDRGRGAAGQSISHALRSRSFIGLVSAAGLFSAAYYGLSVHFVPVLKVSGMDLRAAAGVAGLIGVFSVMGRLTTGFLLDRLPTRLVGVIAFLLPLGAVGLLLAFPGSLPAAIGAVTFLGFASGAELDIVTYIAARRFGQEVFGAIYATFMAIISVCASIGPVVAGALFDASQTYSGYLAIVAPMVIVAALLVAWIPLSAEEIEQR
ncbi:MFS transporter [Novosphingobium sp. G106]|uniref:MFS transporter n=1 Tax=Novosphingobium sp. G106 TaxID=2849500 RepID=UPI001C2CE04C|nr:MFS transporter [Novosphingobium sp. G106]MBV1689004.1 MFS transporter [Novosphingobium sp. G106]